jgi:hypothetical protein
MNPTRLCLALQLAGLRSPAHMHRRVHCSYFALILSLRSYLHPLEGILR